MFSKDQCTLTLMLAQFAPHTQAHLKDLQHDGDNDVQQEKCRHDLERHPVERGPDWPPTLAWRNARTVMYEGKHKGVKNRI